MGPFTVGCFLKPSNHLYQHHLGTLQKRKFLAPSWHLLNRTSEVGSSNGCFNTYSRWFCCTLKFEKYCSKSATDSHSSCPRLAQGRHVTLFWLLRCGRFVWGASGKRVLSLKRDAWKNKSHPWSFYQVMWGWNSCGIYWWWGEVTEWTGRS